MDKTLLLVDDEEHVSKAIQRLCRKEGYQIHVACCAEDALLILKDRPISVILSDHRLPGISGVQFLSQIKQLYPDTLRLMISGYTELESLAGAINDGAIFKFVFKPWDEQQLLANLREAFSIFELKQRNKILTSELTALNTDLEKRVVDKTRELQLHVRSLNVSREIFDRLPFIAIGVSEDDFIVGANEFSKKVLCNSALVGATIKQALPADLYGAFTMWREGLESNQANKRSEEQEFVTDYGRFTTSFSEFGTGGEVRGYLISGKESCNEKGN